ncbi:MAG TPA: hypothetical protein VFU02_17885 [Polyangiaceae bacterium]|nr:hypothetical protein [Polyangiaceae bacterium]
MRLGAIIGLAFVGAVALRCANTSASAERADSEPGGDGGPNTGVTSTTGGGTPEPPPEQELEDAFRVPVATGRFVWTANPESNRVALIDATDFSVAVLDAGFAPTYLAALPNSVEERSGAIVINAASNDATVFLAKDTTDVVVSPPVPIHASANAWAVSSSGRWAIAWTNVKGVVGPDPTDGFQDVSIIDLADYPDAEPTVARLSVGYRPTRIVFADDERRAFAVTEPGVSVIELSGDEAPRVERDVVVSDEPAAEVEIAPSGTLAWVRQVNSANLNLVDLETGERVSLGLPDVVTDLDISLDASFAIAVCRGSVDDGASGVGGAGATGAAGAAGAAAGGEAGAAPAAGGQGPGSEEALSTVVVLPMPDTVSAPEAELTLAIPEVVGSVVVPPVGSQILLYTNAIDNDRVTVLDVSDGSWRTIELKAPVRALFATPDAEHAVALLAPPAGSAKAGAFSLISVARDLPPKLQGTPAPTLGVALSSGSAIVTTLAEANGDSQAYLASFPSLRLETLELPSAPRASGILTDVNVGYVAQAHPEGRITFMDLNNASARTLTGFELGVKVVDGE